MALCGLREPKSSPVVGIYRLQRMDYGYGAATLRDTFAI